MVSVYIAPEEPVIPGKVKFDTQRPEWAKAAIIAEMQQDESDSMTDYFNTSTSRTVVIGWSKHTRNLFSEMRKAAATFPETAHLGPGKDRYMPSVRIGRDFQGNGAYYGKGQGSKWHRELTERDYKQIVFETAEEAQEHIDNCGTPHDIGFGEEGVVSFYWEIEKESVEHRDNYSMGRGYVLGAGNYRTGWIVKKQSLDWGIDHLYKIFTNPENYFPFEKKEIAPKKEKIKLTHPTEHFMEIRFPTEPSDIVRAQLKRGGWSKCSRGFWYQKYTPEKWAETLKQINF